MSQLKAIKPYLFWKNHIWWDDSFNIYCNFFATVPLFEDGKVTDLICRASHLGATVAATPAEKRQHVALIPFMERMGSVVFIHRGWPDAYCMYCTYYSYTRGRAELLSSSLTNDQTLVGSNTQRWRHFAILPQISWRDSVTRFFSTGFHQTAPSGPKKHVWNPFWLKKNYS